MDPPSHGPSISDLVERSIRSWQSMTWASLSYDKTEAVAKHSSKLQQMKTVEDILQSREYWFFLTRKCFITCPRLERWAANRLGDYILLPIDYGFVNNQDCVFISHFWRTRQHPDPDGVDLAIFVQDLQGQEWSYVWLDWSCMPQQLDNEAPRSMSERHYFKLMLTCVSMLIRDCLFEWRYPSFEPRAWVLYEIAEYVLCHENFEITEDNRTLIEHVFEMVRTKSTNLVLEKHKYRCTNDSDLALIRGWLELLIIIVRIFPRDIVRRQAVLDVINKPAVGNFFWAEYGLKIDKKLGRVEFQDKVYNFAPMFDLQASAAVDQF